MAKLTLIRGLPGSGKSTMARHRLAIGEADYHFEADQYFNYNGHYHFDPSKIKDAHLWCQAEVRAALAMGYRVVVSNTFTQRWEMAPYLEMCPDAHILTATGNYTNVHGVPAEVIERMRARWEE